MLKPKIILKSLSSCISLLLLLFITQVSKAQDQFIDLLQNELKREVSVLEKQDVPPYYMCYRVNDVSSATVSTSFGTVINSEKNNKRILTVNVRVGSHELDNTHELRGNRNFSFSMMGFPVILPLDNGPEAVRQILWKETNQQYRQAVSKYAQLKANVAVKIEEEDQSPDFSNQSEAVIYYEEPLNTEETNFNHQKWEERLKKYSSLFLMQPDIYVGRAEIRYTVGRKYFVSSEGTKIVQNTTYAKLFVSGTIKSEDGMELLLYKTYFAFKPDNLPDSDQIISDVKAMIAKLAALKDAPVVDPYSGPAIISGNAAGVFFHEIFGHRVEGHRQKSEKDAQTFKKKIGELVLPKHMSVEFDPSLESLNNQDLVGYYKYDDEGMKGEKVKVVENGILKEFLMSRKPIENFSYSNGHGRASAGRQPVARQSNLIVKTTKPLTMEKLRKKLIKECKKQGKEFGYLFMNVTGGFTFTQRVIPNAFNVMPTEVYKIYIDGRPDELVRGVDLIGTPLTMFSQITDTGNKTETFTGVCGAESGWVPVSASSPALFVKRIEIQKKIKSQERPPILPRPQLKKGYD